MNVKHQISCATLSFLVSHLCFFASLNKERNSSYLHLSRRLNGKMLVLGFLYSKSTPIVQQKNATKLTNKSTLKIVYSKSPVHSHDPKFLFPHWYKTVSSVYNKHTSKWSSNARIWSKYELYTPKPSQFHETVQQKCNCKISYGTTFDYYDPQAILQLCDTSYLSLPSLNQRNGHFCLVQLEKLDDVTLVRPKWIRSMFSLTMDTMVSDRSPSM